MLSPDRAPAAGAAFAAARVLADVGLPAGVGVPAAPGVAVAVGAPGAAGASLGAGAGAMPAPAAGAAGTAGTAGAGTAGATVPGAAGGGAPGVAGAGADGVEGRLGVPPGEGEEDVDGAVLRVGVGPDSSSAVGVGDGLHEPLSPSMSPPRPTETDAVGASGLGVGVAAWVAGTPAVRTSTAPSAAAAVPRRSPPWPAGELKSSDLCVTMVIDCSGRSGGGENLPTRYFPASGGRPGAATGGHGAGFRVRNPGQ